MNEKSPCVAHFPLDAIWQPKSEHISFVAQFTGSETTQDLALAILYRNKPDQGERAQYGLAHDGACLLMLQEVPRERGAKSVCPWKLIGDYMTNKQIGKTSGSTGVLSCDFIHGTRSPANPRPFQEFRCFHKPDRHQLAGHLAAQTCMKTGAHSLGR